MKDLFITRELWGHSTLTLYAIKVTRYANQTKIGWAQAVGPAATLMLATEAHLTCTNLPMARRPKHLKKPGKLQVDALQQKCRYCKTHRGARGFDKFHHVFFMVLCVVFFMSLTQFIYHWFKPTHLCCVYYHCILHFGLLVLIYNCTHFD